MLEDYTVFNKKYSTTLFQNFYTDKFYLLNKDGSLIIEGDSLKNAYFKRIEGEKPLEYEYYERYYSRSFHAFLVKHKDGSQTIHSGNGDVIFNREQLSKGDVIGLSPNHRFAIMANKVGKFFIADIEKNKIYEQDFETSLEKLEKIRRTDIEFLNDKEFVFHQQLKKYYEESNYKPVSLWNIETGEKIVSLGTYGSFSVGEQEITCYTYNGSYDNKHFNFKGKEISSEKSFYGLSKIGKNYLRKLSLVNSSNKLIKDFKAYDEDIKRAQVLDNQTYTSTKKGRVYCWDSVGTLLWSIDNQLNKDRTVRLINDDYLFCAKKKNITYFDRKGNLLMHCNNYFAVPGINGFEDFYVFLSTNSGAQSARIKNEKIAKNIYEVQLSNKDRFFITYVAVDDENKSLIEKYQKALNQKSLRARKNKKTSNEFARKLSINQFGLYNYDRFYKNPDAIVFTADFEIPGTGFDVRETEVFQITGLNNRAVIRHNENSFDKFSIVKDFPNQLLVILPDEKVAVFSQEDFNTIDIEKLKKEKKYTFKLKVLDKIESASQLASILNTGGV